MWPFKPKKDKEELSEQGIKKIVEGLKAMKETEEAMKKGEEETVYYSSLEEKGRNLVNYFIKKLGIKAISEKDYPTFIVKMGGSEAFYEGKTNIIELGSPEMLEKSNKIGEEFGHFVREKLRPDHKEILTDEFFGWLGARLLYEYTKKNGVSEYPAFKVPKSFEVRRLKEIREEFKKLEEKYNKEEETKRREIEEEVKNLGDERYEILTHERGYDFASKLDLSRIHNFEKLYSMPDNEVRRRFFTPNPDYSGL